MFSVKRRLSDIEASRLDLMALGVGGLVARAETAVSQTRLMIFRLFTTFEQAQVSYNRQPRTVTP